MPIIDEDVLLGITTSGVTTNIPEPKAPESDQEERPGFIETAKAFTATENPLFGAAKSLGIGLPDVSDEFDPDFSPIEKLRSERPELSDYASNFIEVKNEQQYNRKLFNIEDELKQKEIFQKSSTLTKLSSGLAASIVDPLILIPAVGTISKASAAGRAVQGASQGIALGAAAGTVREGLLQATQETRTAEESITNIIAESALGGILGAGVGALSAPARGATQKVFAKALDGDDIPININSDNTLSVGAAETASELDDLGLAHINEKLAKVISGPEALRPPELRAALSPSESVRKIGEVFYNSNFIRNKNVEGISSGPKAQNAIFRREQGIIKTLKDADNLYLNYAGTTQLRAAFGAPKGKISHQDFSKRVWQNMTDANRIDEIAEVNKAAQVLRADMDKMAKELQQAKLLPEDIDPVVMRNYMSRVYNTDALMAPAARQRFVSKVSNWIRTHNKDGSLRKVIMDQDVADDEALKILDKIRGETDQQIAMSSISEGFVSKGKFLKERQLLIPDKEIAEFLDTDSLRLFKNYMTRASKLLETQKALENSGFESIQDVIKQIREESNRAAKGLGDDAVEAMNIGKKFKSEEDLANMMYRSMLGQLRKPGKGDRWAEGLLNYQFVRLLGGVTISSFPEAVMVPFRQGFFKTFRDGYLPMLRDFKNAKLSKDQLNDLTGALEFEQANVLRALGGIDDLDNLGRGKSKWEGYMDALTKGFTKASFIGHWTSMHRRIAAQVSASDLTRTIRRGPQGRDIERLAALGISKSDYARIDAQIQKHVQSYKGSYAINPHLWDDAEALEIFQSAIQTEIESAILKPGVESLPFFVQQNQWVKVMFQFKSFMSAATSKIAISGIQRRDKKVLTGAMGLITMGMLSSMAHDMVAGREIKENPEELLLDGISRSGILGLLMTTVLDTGKTFYSEKTNRFGGKFVSSNILGPSAGQIEELTRALQRVTDGDVTEKDIKALLRNIPFNNLFYIKALTDRVFSE